MDIKFIRENPDLVRKNQKKRFKDPADVDLILSLDKEWREHFYQGNTLGALRNRLAKAFRDAPTVPALKITQSYTVKNLVSDLLVSKQNPHKLTKHQLGAVSRELKEMLSQNNALTEDVLERRDNVIAELGNFLYDDVKVSNDEDWNKVIAEVDNTSLLTFERPAEFQSHIDLLPRLGFVDYDNGINVAGNRGYFLTGLGVKLNRAIISYAQDLLEEDGYQHMSTPVFVTGELMSKISQLSDYQETLYKLDGKDTYLIATSEQPMTAYFVDKRMHTNDLPIKFAGISNCFRREAGSHNKNTRGIYRVHQFEKVEQFCVVEPDQSWDMFHKMMGLSRKFYDSLGISYHVVSIVSGALNNAASMKYDLEAYFPGAEEHCELVSCTNCLDFFSKRINFKCLDVYPHMLNCTLCANTRTLCCLVETYQTKDGFVVPEVLRPYMGNLEFIPFKN